MFKVDDRVTDIKMMKNGRVTCISNNYCYTVTVLYDDGNEEKYTEEGKLHSADATPMLYPKGTTITITKPKKYIYQWIYKPKDCPGTFLISANRYMSSSHFNKDNPDYIATSRVEESKEEMP